MEQPISSSSHTDAVQRAMSKACGRVAPVFDVRDMVAVNPFMGYTDKTFIEAAIAVEAVFHQEVLPGEPGPIGPRVNCVADLVARARPDEERAVTKSLMRFLGARYCEQPGLVTSTLRNGSLFRSFLVHASTDAGPEIWGLAGYRDLSRTVREAPSVATTAWIRRLGLVEEDLERYFSRLLARVNGYAGLLRAKGFANEDTTELQQLLQILTFIDFALATLCDEEFWPHFEAGQPGFFDSRQRKLAALGSKEGALADQLTLSLRAKSAEAAERPTAQLVFCIDVRSEPYRRSLEKDPDIQTYGFAGFFGLPIAVDLSTGTRPHCPPLLTPSMVFRQPPPTGSPVLANLATCLKHALSSPISSLSHVEGIGLSYLARLFANGAPSSDPRLAEVAQPDGLDQVDLDQQVQLAAGLLKNVSITTPLARLVVFVGHGSHVTNNAQAAGLACGACAGHSGAPNAQIAAAFLNSPPVRERLAASGWAIGPDVYFLAAEHDTMTETVRLLSYDVPRSHENDVQALRVQLERASATRRIERVVHASNPRQALEVLAKRGNDFAQTQPEWGLAGNAAFLIGNRGLSRELRLDGRAFLHSYDEARDDDGSVLEMILTAPALVGSWINLQYYASSVAPAVFGAGRKTLHNPMGSIGVIEGGQGDLAVGLARESLVRDGLQVHEPLRLQILVQASVERIIQIVTRNESIRRLVVGQWVHLHALRQTADGVTAQRLGSEWFEEAAPGVVAAE